MNMFVWSSEMLKQYGNGQIVVMAESVDDARDIFTKRLEENISLIRLNSKINDGEIEYTSGFQVLDRYVFYISGQDDEDIDEYIDFIRTTFMDDISKQPTILDDIFLIMGSE